MACLVVMETNKVWGEPGQRKAALCLCAQNALTAEASVPLHPGVAESIQWFPKQTDAQSDVNLPQVTQQAVSSTQTHNDHRLSFPSHKHT